MSDPKTAPLPTDAPSAPAALSVNSPLGRAVDWTEIGTYAEALQWAELVSRSTFCPKAFQGNPGEIVVAWYFGKQLDLPPMSALQHLAVINGKPCIYGAAIPALCMTHNEFMGTRVVWGDDEDALDCTVHVRRRMPDGEVQEFSGHFSKAKAETAKLWGKLDKYGKPTPWVLYPHDMIQRRAASRAWRAAFSDRLMGLTSSDEAEDIRTVDVEVRDTGASAAVKAVEVALTGGAKEEKPAENKPLEGAKIDPETLPAFQRKTKPTKKESSEGDRWLRTSDDVVHVFRNGTWVVEGSSDDVPAPDDAPSDEGPEDDPRLSAGDEPAGDGAPEDLDEPESQEMDRKAMADYFNKNANRMPAGFLPGLRKRFDIPEGQGLSALSDEDLYDVVREIEGHISV